MNQRVQCKISEVATFLKLQKIFRFCGCVHLQSLI